MIKAMRFLCAPSLVLGLAGCMGFQGQLQERSFISAFDDLRIQAELNARLLSDSATLFANVDTTVIEGRIHMSGTVPDQQDRIKVTRIAWGIPAAKEVVNDIEVASDVGIVDAARDHLITAQLRSMILADRDIRDSNYSIDTENGVIYVTGIAQGKQELERVLAHANAVREARRVVNYVVMKDDPRRFVRSKMHPGERVASSSDQ